MLHLSARFTAYPSGFEVLAARFSHAKFVEAPDNVAIARASAELASRGSVKIQTLAAISIDEFIAAFD